MSGNTSDQTTLPEFLRKVDITVPGEDEPIHAETFTFGLNRKKFCKARRGEGTYDERNLILPRYTQPEKELQLLLHQLNLRRPGNRPPRREELKKKCSEDL
ncbi:MAG: hypothetical protein PWQ29_677 [Verrucomicrobiota bacterium]|jgi:hypothetical protein|nr:hypothetical protein [Verrucomicrobiota bacterium]